MAAEDDEFQVTFEPVRGGLHIGPVTEEEIERGARAYFNAELEVGSIIEKPWDETLEMVRDEYRKAASIVLRAAFSRN